MMVESNHVIALVLIKLGFRVGSKTIIVNNYSSNQKQAGC